jgi:3-oxoadipate enol-lactonase
LTKTVSLHYEDSGAKSGPPVLLGGSLGTSGAMWDPQVEVLCKHVRTIAFDHRGHGSSPAPEGPYAIADLGRDVLALMDRLKLAKASYVGLSIGGMVGQWLAGNHPERIDKLVLIATSAYLGDGAPWIERAAVVRGAGTTEVVADAVLARWFTPHWSTAHHRVVAELREMICSTPAEGYAACCDALAALDLRAELTRITAPTLVIGGAEDLAIPPANQQAIVSAVAGSRLQLIEDAAHIPTIQHPDTVNELIAEHLEVQL